MFSKTILAGAFATLAAAQSAVLTFTHVPNPVTDGQAQAITFATNDTMTPVTIILRKGVSDDLLTVSTLTSTATGGQFIWTPAKSIANGADYALQITQGSQTNYFGPFSIQGADPSAVSAASSSSMTASSSAYLSSTVSANGTASTTVPVGTIGSGMATGTAMARNTTMSSATLTGFPTGSATGMATTQGSGSATTTGAGFQGSETASASASQSSSDASTVQAGSGLLLGAVAAIFYLQQSGSA